jgi:hypothetical protein
VASGAKESTLQIECYSNNFVINDAKNTMPYVFWIRGGTAVVWGNIISQTGNFNTAKFFYLTVECSNTNNVFGQPAWKCESCSNYLSDYPSFQQVGRGVVSGSEGSCPVYFWSNNVPYTPYVDFAFGAGSDASFIQQGRDVYTNSVMPGYTPLIYPHPLVSSGGTVTGTGTGTGTGAVIPPANLQTHPPATQ